MFHSLILILTNKENKSRRENLKQKPIFIQTIESINKMCFDWFAIKLTHWLFIKDADFYVIIFCFVLFFHSIYLFAFYFYYSHFVFYFSTICSSIFLHYFFYYYFLFSHFACISSLKQFEFITQFLFQCVYSHFIFTFSSLLSLRLSPSIFLHSFSFSFYKLKLLCYFYWQMVSAW